MNLRALLSLVAALCCAAGSSAYNFSISKLQGVTLQPVTSLQFGPDNRLYVAQVSGDILILDVQRIGPNNYQVVSTETINLIKNIPNYDDDGTRNFTLTTRQVTGLLVTGTASNPVIYVSSSDPRIGGGSGGENDLNLDTNSGIISRLTRSGSTWSKIDLVRGLPRSEENHATNGMQFDALHNRLIVAQGGNTNAGGPSIGFAYFGETAYAAAVLSVDLAALNALPVKTDAYGQKYLYNLPTLDDPNPSRAHNPDSSDVNDPFGGNDGLNQAKLVVGGPVQIFAPGFRNPYDVVLTRAPGRENRIYTFDNGANNGWGGYPHNEGPAGTATNQYVEGEPGLVNNKDALHFVTGQGYYGGHPHPLRANPTGAGWFHYDGTQPEGSQKIFSLTPTSDWPAVPASMANPIEGDYRLPGTAASTAIMTYTHSTNGLTEYVATNFGGEMQGNLIAATYNGNLLRIALNAAGTAVTNGVEILASGFGSLPLDVTAPIPGQGSPFVGTIWVAHYQPAKISVLEPADFDSPGSSTCTGVNSFDVDEDGDGYSNADEILNGSNPCSGSVRPPDVDEDFQSDTLDQDDDNDGITDVNDAFPLDPHNGLTVPLPLTYNLFNETGIGFYGVGFTGVMRKPGEDYLARLSADNIIAGGTAGLFTLAEAGPGSPRAGSNSQKDAYHLGFNSDEFTTPYVITSRLAGPFFASNPAGNQVHGIYLGNGDQNNYVSLALHAHGGAGGIQVVYESGGTIQFEHIYSFPTLNESSNIDLGFVVDPLAGTVQPRYSIPGTEGIVTLGDPIEVDGATLEAMMGAQPLAIGLFANTGGGGAPTFSATWDFFDIAPLNDTAVAKFTIDPPVTDMATASAYTAGGWKIHNTSTGGQHIESVVIDLSTAIFPDMVFDPTGTAGDPDSKPFSPNSSSGGVTGPTGVNTLPHNGTDGEDGYDGLEIDFAAFPPNGQFAFSIDVDPTSVKGVAAPGQNHSASVSGLELIGSTVTVYFSDGSVHRTRLGRLENTLDGSYGWLRSEKPPKPGISVPGKSSPLLTGSAETVRVTGPAGLNVTLTVIESALYIGGVPGGGYDLDPYEANTAIKLTEKTAVIGENGYVDIEVTPTKSNADAGFNYLTAVLSNAGGVKGPASDNLIIAYDPSYQGGDTQAPTAPDGLAVSEQTIRSLKLNWTAATDNVGVTGYEIRRNGTLIATVTSLSYTDIGLDSGVTYNYSVLARDEAGNTSPADTLAAATAPGGTTVQRINAGGSSYIDASGHLWSSDAGYNTGATSSTTNAIDATPDDPLFKTERYDPAAAPDLVYSLSVSNGHYEVQLFLAETHAPAAGNGLRVFDVYLENQLAIDNVDIFARAGAPNRAIVAAATTTVTDGQLNIGLVRQLQNPKINAIKIVKLDGGDSQAPSTPGNLAASNVSPTSVQLNWTASTDNVGVTGYVVARDGATLQTVTGTSFTDTGLTPSTAYEYTVRATDAGGNLSAPASVAVTTSAGGGADTQAPTAPGALSFTNVSSTGVQVNWTAATDNVGVTGYRVSRNGGSPTTVTGITFTDTGLAPGTPYTYSVVAVDAAGNTSSATTGNVTTSGSSPDTAVVRVNAGGPAYVDSAGHTWSADKGYNTGKKSTSSGSIAGTSDPTLFHTERYDEAGGNELVYSFNIPNGDYTVRLYFAETYANAQSGGARVFDVEVQNQLAIDDLDIFTRAGGGHKAVIVEAPATVTTGQLKIRFVHGVQNPKINAIEVVQGGPAADTQPPTVPGSLAASDVTTSSVTLEWNPSTDNVGVTGYRVSRNGTVLDTVTGTSFEDDGLSPDTAYQYSVVALDAAGNASTAATTSVTTDPAPSANSILRINAGGPAYVDNAGRTWSADTGFNTGKKSTSSGTIAGTPDPTLFHSERYDEVGGSELVYSFNVPNGSYLVRLFFAETYANGQSVGARVFDVEVQNQLALDNVDIFAQAGGGFKALTLEVPATVTAGQLKIRFVHGVQNPKINAIEVLAVTGPAPGDTQAPTAPTNLTSPAKTTTTVSLSWAAASDNVGVTGYRVSRNGGAPVTVTSTSYTDTGLTAGTAYAYSVRAVDAAGNQSAAATLNVTTAAASDTQPPTAPTGLQASGVTATSLSLNWNASTDNVAVTGYRVSRNGTVLQTVTGTSFADSGLTASTSYSYGVVALDAAGNASTAATVNVTTGGTPPADQAVVRINAGGSAFVDSAGRTWAADSGYNTGKTAASTGTVTGTPNPTLFATERYDEATGNELVYSFNIPNGSYLVRLHVAETYAGAQSVGARVFDVELQNQLAINDVDIFAQAGGGFKAVILEAPATVTAGQLKIRFVHVLQNPKVNAIEVVPAGPAP